MAILEAAAAGLPELITDKCHIPEIAHAGAGLVVPDTVDAIETGLRQLLAMDAADLAEMGRRGAKLIADNYTWDRIGERLIVAYRQAIDDCRCRGGPPASLADPARREFRRRGPGGGPRAGCRGRCRDSAGLRAPPRRRCRCCAGRPAPGAARIEAMRFRSSARNSSHSVTIASASRAGCRLVGIVRERHLRQAAAAPVPSLPDRRRAPSRRHPAAPGSTPATGRVAHVVGVGLERQPQHRHRPPARVPAHRPDHLAPHRPLARIVHLHHRLDDPQRRLIVLRRLQAAPACPWESTSRHSPAPHGGTSTADAVVQTDPARHLLHVRAHDLAQVRQLVDEGDLRRQERIRGIFGELGRPPAR